MSNNEASNESEDGGSNPGDLPNDNPGVNPDDTTQGPHPFEGAGVPNSRVRVSMDPDGIYPEVNYRLFRHPSAGDPQNITS